jgi:hypothetical protein
MSAASAGIFYLEEEQEEDAVRAFPRVQRWPACSIIHLSFRPRGTR